MKKVLTQLGWIGALSISFLVSYEALSQQQPPANLEASRIPVADFFKSPAFSKATLSPDGTQIAMLAAGANNRMVLAVMSVVDRQPKILANYTNADVIDLHWVNNHRLVYSLANRNLDKNEEDGSPGLFAVDVDGKKERQLILRWSKPSTNYQRALTWNHTYAGPADSDHPDDIYVVKYTYLKNVKRYMVDLLRLNTYTGITTPISRPGDVIGWLWDKNRIPRIAITLEENKTITYLKKDEGNWVKLFEDNASEEDDMRVEFLDGKNQLFVSKLRNHNFRELYQFDMDKLEVAKQPTLAFEGYDYNGAPVFDQTTGEWLGLQYETDAPSSYWLHPEIKKIQAQVDQILSGKTNRLAPHSKELMLVYSFADNDPGTYYLFYPNKKPALVTLGQSRPWINPEQMAYVDPIKIKARDGWILPGYITMPKNQKKNLPMVVLVHGGPNVRGEHWIWNNTSQFLASRGYAVLQVDYRGSQGYGLQHEKQGWKQWGLRMQDDITDATQWAINSGIADAKRICIAGASYGGYATLWGLIKEPHLYRCGVSWVGVSAPAYLYSISWSDISTQGEKYYLPTKLGDPKKDAAQFEATSAVAHAAQLKQPLILAYGAQDRRVPIEHGTRMRDALKAHNQQVEWIVYPNEAHGWQRLENNIDFWTRVEKFLAQHTEKNSDKK